MWNDFPYTVFDTGRLGGFKELSIDGFPELCFSVSCDVGACGVAKANYKQYFFSHGPLLPVLIIIIILLLLKKIGNARLGEGD